MSWGLKLYSAIKIVSHILCASIRCFGNLAPVYSYYLIMSDSPPRGPWGPRAALFYGLGGAQFQLIQFPKVIWAVDFQKVKITILGLETK